jgi:hypothetical protein
MRLNWLAPAAVSVIMTAAVLGGTAGSASAVQARPPDHGWGPAVQIAGTGSLLTGVELSCPAAGRCLAAGTGKHGANSVPFVASQTATGWSRAKPVPGIAALDRGTSAFLSALSCGAPGYCVAGGDYIVSDPGRHLLPFVAVERRGRWRQAIELPDVAALSSAMAGGVTTVSCPSPGYCLAGGWYQQGSSHSGLPFVVSMTNGRWGAPIELPGWGTMSAGGFTQVTSVSCGSAGNCAATLSGPFVASLVNGSWHNVIKLPGTLTRPGIDALSCARAGACAVGGEFDVSQAQVGAFVASGQHGTWSHALQVPGTSGATMAGVASVSCTSHGCLAGGAVQPSQTPEAFVLRQAGSAWSPAAILPGIEKLDRHTGSSLTALSCGTAGNCVAAGSYSTSFRGLQPLIFVAARVHGTWRQATSLAGIAVLATGNIASVTAASCPATGACVVAGTLTLSKGGRRAFIAVQR